MTQGELKRLHVIHKAIDKSITQVEAVGIIGVCLRQAQRIVRTVKPANDTDLHWSVPKGNNLDKILCVKTARALRNDFTVAHNGRLYQIEDTVGAKDIVVEERITGSMLITYKDTSLRFKEITARPEKEQEKPFAPTPKKIYIPPKEHPWRKFRLSGSVNFEEKEAVLAGAL